MNYDMDIPPQAFMLGLLSAFDNSFLQLFVLIFVRKTPQ